MPVTRPDIFSPAIKAQGNEGERRILLGDNTGSGAVVLRPIGFQCDGIWLSTELPCLCMYIVGNVHTGSVDRDSSVGIATGSRLDGPEIEF